MNKPVAAIEITNKSLKLVVGYEIDGKIDILYSLVKPLGEVRFNNEFIDINALSVSLQSLKTINDVDSRLEINLSDVLVALPPYQLLVYSTQQMIGVVSDDSHVGNLDLHNLYTIIQKSRIPTSNTHTIVDIIPSQFTLDEGRTYLKAPIGEISSSISITAFIHTLPKKLIEDFQEVFSLADLKVQRFDAASFATSELLSTYPNVPKDYILVDIGAKQTSVSVIGDKNLYFSDTFDFGGDDITHAIMVAFNVSECEAEKIKIEYGLDKRELNFQAPVYTFVDEEGHEVKHYLDELNKITRNEIDRFVSKVNETINNLLKDSPQNKSLPMLLIGGGSLLRGLEEYILPKVVSNSVKVVIPTTLGCRNPAFFNCLGMIYVNEKYPLLNDERTPKLTGVSRNSVK